ncbi:MAG: ankyrin repeat domain-containing protein, partial [Synergistaceae bacterium]|nr:ankyrin repeat domain-containing protein [Synergistaceae bacterium]
MKKAVVAVVLLLAAVSCAFADASSDLLRAARNEKVQITAKMLNKFLENGADINAKDSEGKTPLMLIAEYADAKTVRMFIEAGADVDATDEDEVTALMIAAEENFEHPDVVSLIIAAGADVDAQNEDGVTALMRAAEESSTNRDDDDDDDDD